MAYTVKELKKLHIYLTVIYIQKQRLTFYCQPINQNSMKYFILYARLPDLQIIIRKENEKSYKII